MISTLKAPDSSSISESKDGFPLARLAKLNRHENSKSEGQIPKMELAPTLAISSAKEGKSVPIYNLAKS